MESTPTFSTFFDSRKSQKKWRNYNNSSNSKSSKRYQTFTSVDEVGDPTLYGLVENIVKDSFKRAEPGGKIRSICQLMIASRNQNQSKENN